MRRFEWLMGFIAVGTVAGASATACSSSGSTTTYPPQNPDSGTTPETDASMTTAADAAEEEAASAVTPMDCPDGSVGLPDGGAGSVSAACVTCVQTSCGSELAACATDCACGPGETCLLSMGYNGSECTAAMSALFNTEPGLTNLEHCVATTCNPECFGDGG